MALRLTVIGAGYLGVTLAADTLAADTLGAVVAHKRPLDGRNALDPERWRAAGWTYRALGRP